MSGFISSLVIIPLTTEIHLFQQVSASSIFKNLHLLDGNLI